MKRDSLLNRITDVPTQIKVKSTKDTSFVGLTILQVNDSLSRIRRPSTIKMRDAKGLLTVPNNFIPFDNSVLFSDTILFDPSFLPVIFDGKLFSPDLNFLSKIPSTNKVASYHLISPDSTFMPLLNKAQRIGDIRRYYSINNPQYIKLNALKFSDTSVLDQKTVPKKNALQELISTDNAIELSKPDVEKHTIKTVYWQLEGEHRLDISQNQLSDKWHQGGNNNFDVRNYHRLVLKYRRNKLTYQNTIEWRLNFQKTPADTLHKVSINDDNFRTYNELRLDAFKKWTYTLNLEAKTPFFNRYPVNSDYKLTAFLSPLEVNAGIGMGYNLEKRFKRNKFRRMKISLNIAPVSINYKFVEDGDVDERRFGIEEGKKAKTDYGSTLNCNFDYDFNKSTESRAWINYFTNYEKAIIQFEEKLTFRLNNYFTTSVTLKIRYDDGIAFQNKDEKLGYFQYYETLGLGLIYRW